MGCHMSVLPQPSSSYSDDPPDCTVFCSLILDSTLIVNKDQSIDGDGVTQTICVVMHEEYDWYPEH